MAIHHLTPPIRGGERPRLPSAQRGPVTIALAAMQAADPNRQRLCDLRRAIADRIEADIALLDALAGDPDLEDNGDSEPSLGSLHGTAVACAIPFQWAGGCTQDGEYDSGEDREEENEHGGDIQDEPHDPQVDDIQKDEHRWDPSMASMARAARRQAEVLRARMNGRGRA